MFRRLAAEIVSWFGLGSYATSVHHTLVHDSTPGAILLGFNLHLTAHLQGGPY